MLWLTGSKLQIQSELPLDAAREAIRTSTVHILSDDADSEKCVGITFGKTLFVSRPSWRKLTFIPGPVFRGKLQPTESGSAISGRFTIPIFSVVIVFLCACFAALIGLAIESDLTTHPIERMVMIFGWLLFCLPLVLIARWMMRLPWVYAKQDEAFIERHLRQALDASDE